MFIDYFDALAGAGKTRALSRHADRLARHGHKVLFVQPTMHLITATLENEIQPLNPAYKVRALHGETVPNDKSVVAEIVEYFRAAEPERGEVLFITHAAFFRTPYFERKRDWVLLMDEVPPVDVFEDLNLHDTHHLLTPYLTLIPGGAAYGTLLANEDLTALGGEDD
ncbi:DEAD/DEAH box helicase family protein [Alsobacter sp. SYSU BS001988]